MDKMTKTRQYEREIHQKGGQMHIIFHSVRLAAKIVSPFQEHRIALSIF